MRIREIDQTLDILVVGAGPAALTVLHAAGKASLEAAAVDKGPVCGALMKHPTYMRWFSTSDKLELAGFPMMSREKNPTRREYLTYCRAFVRFFGLRILTYLEVTGIESSEEEFIVAARDMHGRPSEWRAKNVVLATGFYDSPRPLGIPGEALPKVCHRYIETHPYVNQEVLVIGAGSSAAEAALELWRDGARVSVAMRGDRFSTKYWIEPDIENRIREGAILCYREVEVEEITPDDVKLRSKEGQEIIIENDFVLAMTGYEPDTSLLESLGARIEGEARKPVLNAFLETTVRGLYVAGTLCAGCESNTVFIENSREHGAAIVKGIVKRRRRS